MSLERRLSDLEAKASRTDPRRQAPIEARLLCKAVARYQARENGEELPAYSPDEIQHLYEDDVATVAGSGVAGELRAGAGWESPEALEMLAAWEEAARRRLERIEDGERLEDVYADE